MRNIFKSLLLIISCLIAISTGAANALTLDEQPSGDNYAYWRFSGGDAPAVGDSENGTKMNVEFLIVESESKFYQNEDASYNSDVPDDMKSLGSKGIKLGANALYLKVTIEGGFKAGDVLHICGHNPWKVSSSNEHSGDVAASIATGTSETDYNVGTCTLSTDADALYLMKAEDTETGICALKVVRGSGDTEEESGDEDPEESGDEDPEESGDEDPEESGDKPLDPELIDGLTLHIPEVYNAKSSEGGYDAQTTFVNGDEYEVFYINRDETGTLLTIATTNVDKSGSISDADKSSVKKTITVDGWAKISGSNGTEEDQNASAKDEFLTSLRSVNFNSESHELKMHIKGYNQFSFYGKDNDTESDDKHFEVYIDGVKQSTTPSDYAIHRYNFTSSEHVISLMVIGDSDNKLCSFSLRVAQEPRTKYLEGNDSTQVIMQTLAPEPVYYFTKYHSHGTTSLEWEGEEGTGFKLETKGESTIGDTLVLTGKALCPVGEYTYHIVSRFNDEVINLVSGKLSVASEIQALTDTIVDTYQKEEMERITFSYYALSANDIEVNWLNDEPKGLVGSGKNGRFTISGTPQTEGTFDYAITVAGGNTITGRIIVRPLDMSNNPVLYLYKNNGAFEQDAIYQYLVSAGNNLVARKAQENGLRKDYRKYKWVMISEDADADNKEVLAVVRGGSNLPVLNLNGFTYAKDRLNWGDPNNGTVDTVDNNGCHIWIHRGDHPIFQKLGWTDGQRVQILEKYDQKGMMPIAVELPGTYCLATAYTRSTTDYYGNGEMQTVLHEIPTDMRGGCKYICLPLSRRVTLTADGQKLLDNIVEYLLSDQQVELEIPFLEISSFEVEGHAADISQKDNTITLTMSYKEYADLDSLRSAKPVITLAEPTYSHVTPASGEEVSLEFTTFLPKAFVVTDFVTRRVYEFTLKLYIDEAIEDVYEAGQWVNIFDIYGRKLSTTNENIYTLDLPRGIYVVVTESGKTMKIMR